MPICREKPLLKIHDNLFFFLVWSQPCKDCQSQSQNQSNPTLNHISFHFHCCFSYTLDHSGCCSWSQSSAFYCRDKQEFALTPANNLDFPVGLVCVCVCGRKLEHQEGTHTDTQHKEDREGTLLSERAVNPQPCSCEATELLHNWRQQASPHNLLAGFFFVVVLKPSHHGQDLE